MAKAQHVMAVTMKARCRYISYAKQLSSVCKVAQLVK